MQKKILTFISCGEKLLALYSEPHPEHGEGGWFVVTGGVEKDPGRNFRGMAHLSSPLPTKASCLEHQRAYEFDGLSRHGQDGGLDAPCSALGP